MTEMSATPRAMKNPIDLPRPGTTMTPAYASGVMVRGFEPGLRLRLRDRADSLRMLATLTDFAMPKNLKMLIRIQEWSISYHARPCRADVGCAW